MTYHITITGTTPTDQGAIRFTCSIETDASSSWQTLIPAGVR